MNTNGIKYRYTPLDPSRQQIRLLKIERFVPVNCSLHVFDLASAPPYIALSYMWGPPDPSHWILVDYRPFEVRDNLYNFIRTFPVLDYYQRNIEDSYIYIDQICIDQSNIPERNSQVLLMSGIYTNASLVLVWLGNDFRMLQAARDFDQTMEEADEERPTSLPSLEILLSNPYFNRVWIVQEVSLAKDIWILCGDKKLNWSLVEWGIGSLNRLNMTAAVYPSTIKDLFKQKDVKNRRLDNITAIFSEHECQDPKDKVYGFLGLVPEKQRPTVDYAKSTHQVYLDVVLVVLRIYWENKATDRPHNDMHYGLLWIYLENLLKLAWNMNFPEHDQRALVEMFRQVAEYEDYLSKDNPYGLSLTQIIEGFSYEVVTAGKEFDVGYKPGANGSVEHNGVRSIVTNRPFGWELFNKIPEDEGKPGDIKGRWVMVSCGEKTYFECREWSQPMKRFGRYPSWSGLLNYVQRDETPAGKAAWELTKYTGTGSSDEEDEDWEEEELDDFDPSLDPDLRLALEMSVEEEKVRNNR